MRVVVLVEYRVVKVKPPLYHKDGTLWVRKDLLLKPVAFNASWQ